MSNVTLLPLDTVYIVAKDPETGLPHRFDVPGERTGTPGLVLGRALTVEEGWHVIHEPSGRRLPGIPAIGVDIILARRIAEALASVGVKWSDGDATTAALADPETAGRVRDTIWRLLAGHRGAEAYS